jgi:16S rRNA (cytidine1402-2'-O)-methyltransferase
MKPKLYIVSTPIGNYEDITLRALRVLEESDFIICEEFKEARRLLSHFKIKKELISLNEHNEKEVASEVISLLKEGKSIALISDCGTPLFSDPGNYLVKLAIQNNIDILPVPGVSSLLTALVGSGFEFEKFYYYGWLSPKKDIRRKQLWDLRKIKDTIVLLDTPYRLKSLMEDVVKILGPDIPCVLAFELTKENEKFYRTNAGNILSIVEKENLKGEYVLIIKNQ